MGVVALWAGIAMAAHCYPTEFDWRYMTMSTLLSPRDNAPGRHWAEAGMALCGLGILGWTLTFGQSSDSTPSDRRQPPGTWSLRLGSACMVGSALLPLRLPLVPKGHELLTLIAFAGLSLGAVKLTLSVVDNAGGARADSHPSRARCDGAVLAAVVVAPIVLAGLAQAYVYYGRPDLHWVGLSWRARGVPVYLSFAFWEWVTCAILSVYLTALALMRRGRLRAP
jgi:hypothetical protein